MLWQGFTQLIIHKLSRNYSTCYSQLGFLSLFVFSQQHSQVLTALKLNMRFNRANRVLLVLFGTVTLVLGKEGTYQIKATSR